MEPRRLARHLRYGRGRRFASRWRQLVVQATHLHGTVRFEAPVHIGPGFRLDMPSQGQFIVGANVEFRRNFVCEISGGGQVSIGANTVFTYDTIIQCTTSVDIGSDCMIGRALIADGNHRFKDPDRSVTDQGFDFQPITIGDGTLVTTNVVVTAPIGKRCLVGANAVVTSPIPDYSLAVGAPARVVEQYEPHGHPDDAVSTPGA